MKVLIFLASTIGIAWMFADKRVVKEMQPSITKWARPLALVTWALFLLALFY